MRRQRVDRAMLVQYIFAAFLLLLTPSGTMQQCPTDTLVRVHYNHTTSLVDMANVTNVPKCGSGASFSRCCLCGEDKLACLSIDSAIDYTNNAVETSSINGFELTLGKTSATINLTLSAAHVLFTALIE